MTEVSYEIAFNVKAPGGWYTFAFFKLGSEKEQATQTFDSLSGVLQGQDAALRIELLEHNTAGEILLIGHKGCSLDELAENTRTIARDVFKYANLE